MRAKVAKALRRKATTLSIGLPARGLIIYGEGSKAVFNYAGHLSTYQTVRNDINSSRGIYRQLKRERRRAPVVE